MQCAAGTLVLFGTVYLTDLFNGYITRDQSSSQEGNKKHPENSKKMSQIPCKLQRAKLFTQNPQIFPLWKV